MRVLDLGGGRHPLLDRSRLPAGCIYVGMDVSRTELAAAPTGSYDDTVVADARSLHGELVGRFDLIVSWHTLEHIAPLSPALRNLRQYLARGGWLVAEVAGALSLFALANRMLPHALAKPLLRQLFGRTPESVFPARYDRCWHSALADLLDEDGWAEWRLRPLYTGGLYFLFSRLAVAAYLAYEDWACRGGYRNLASYYLLTARR